MPQLRTIIRAAGIAVALLIVLPIFALFILSTVLREDRDSYSPKCDFDLEDELRSRGPGSVPLRVFAAMDWDEVRTFGPYAPLAEIRALGIDYSKLELDSIADGHFMAVFLKGGKAVCASLVAPRDDFHVARQGLESDIWTIASGPMPSAQRQLETLPEVDPVLGRLMGL